VQIELINNRAIRYRREKFKRVRERGRGLKMEGESERERERERERKNRGSEERKIVELGMGEMERKRG
jgi:hypothetical protein